MLGLSLTAAYGNPNPTVDCNCLASIPALHTTCPGIVPDLSLWATNCFSTNVNPAQLGFFNQIPPPGAWLGLGTNQIVIIVQDTNYNSSQCTVDFVVSVPPATNLTFICVSNKTVECGTSWQFDSPTAFSTCCDPGLNVTNVSTVTNGTCPKIITKTWQASDACGNTNYCTQTVTLQDTSPPVPLCSGANLVPNPGFESIAYCPNSVSQIDAAFPWFTPTGSSPDCFNVCDPSGVNVCVPTNYFGYQNAFNGQGYAGAYVYGPTDINNPNGASYREYIESPLLTPLVAGQTYKVSFHVNLADTSGKAIANIGAHFSVGQLIGGGQGPIPVTPQVVNPPGNFLTSTSLWVLVQGTFVAAGGEDHVTLGNFTNDVNTPSISLPSPPQYVYYAYCYYDDVSVEAVCPGTATNKVILCGAPVTFDPPTGFDLCSGTNVGVTVANTVTNGVCPKLITRNWILTDICGNTNTWSQTVTIIDTNPPNLFCDTNNLVPNGNFESYTNCPNNLSQTEYAAPWFTPTLGTSDYFNSCAGPGNLASVPTNLRGTQAAHSGQGYAGGEVFSINNNLPIKCYREYIEAPLVAPLLAGKAYQVSFWVSLADNSGFAIAEVGAHFSVGPLVNYSVDSLLTVTPQVVNPSYNVLTSTNSWMLVQGVFTAAGGEDHITIGSFQTDVNLTSVPIPGGNPAICEYYYDDVSVVPLCGEMLMNKNLPCGSPWTFDPPAGIDDCSGTNVSVTIAGTTTNACSTFFTRTWTLTDLCGNATNWTQTVTISDPSPLSINCACLSEAAANLLYTNGCIGIVPDLLQFTNCFSTNCRPVVRSQSLMPGSKLGTGSHLITVSAVDCFGNSNGCVLAFTVAGSPPTISCPKDLMLYTCGSGAVAFFAPTAFNNTGPVVCSPPSGSFFPANLSSIVTCTATNSCGTATCSFGVSVIRPPGRFSCLIWTVIGIPTLPLGSANVVYLPDSPDGGKGVNFENFGSSGQDGARLDFGPAEKFTFSTTLDFNAVEGGSFTLNLPDTSGGPGIPILSAAKSCRPRCGWDIVVIKGIVENASVPLRSIGIGTNGDLFSSFVHDTTDLDTNVLVHLSPADGASSAMMTMTLDCLTRELTLEFPDCDLTPDNARKGWDGLIYGNPRPAKTNATARVILTPTSPVGAPPITSLDLLASNLTSLAFDNPSITTMGRKWGDGHVTLMKAYDDGEEAISFAPGGPGGGVTTDLGNAAGFSARLGHFEDGDIPTEEQLFTIRGWPPGTTTNRPPPPPIFLRVSASAGGTGVDCAADFTSFGISNVTLQLWNGTTLVSQKPNVPASIASSFITLSARPTMLGCPGLGVLSLSHTNAFIVFSGLDCPGTGCVGTELRILPESSTMSPPPVAFGELTCAVTEGTDNLLYRLQTTPACTPIPLNVSHDSAGNLTLSWDAVGFHLMGAEYATGPWYDLGVSSPLLLNHSHPARYFRLACD